MAKLYIGDSQGAPAIVKVEEVEKTKFGVGIDSLLGSVNAEGEYILPTKPVDLDLTGIKSLPRCAFSNFASNERIILNNVIAPNLEYIAPGAFDNFASFGTILGRAEFGIEEIDTEGAFEYAFRGCEYVPGNIVFPKLKKVSHNSVFSSFLNSMYAAWDDIFPTLEEISGNSPFGNFCSSRDKVQRLSAVKKIQGGIRNKYNATFYGITKHTFYLPNVTYLSDYVFDSTTIEIHFSAVNQALIEECIGYDTKFGATNATIYFDL